MKPRSISALVLFVWVAASAFAQTFTGSITGVVTDASGAVIPAAQIAVLNKGTNIRSAVTSDAGGNYSVPLLPRGEYRVEVTAGGFKRFVREGIELQVQQ